MKKISFNEFKTEILKDYQLAFQAREINRLCNQKSTQQLVYVAIHKVLTSQDNLFLNRYWEHVWDTIQKGEFITFFEQKNEKIPLLDCDTALAYTTGMYFSSEEKQCGISYIVLSILEKKENCVNEKLLRSVLHTKSPVIVTLHDTVGVGESLQKMLKQLDIPFFQVNAWEYDTLCKAYADASTFVGEEQKSVIVLINTTGRYPDTVLQMRRWMLDIQISDVETLDSIEKKSKEEIHAALQKVVEVEHKNNNAISVQIIDLLNKFPEDYKKLPRIKEILKLLTEEGNEYTVEELKTFLNISIRYFTPITESESMQYKDLQAIRKRMFSQGREIVSKEVCGIPAIYSPEMPPQKGSEILQRNFGNLFERYSDLYVCAKQKIIYRTEKIGLKTQDSPFDSHLQVAKAIGIVQNGGQVILEVSNYNRLVKSVQLVHKLGEIYGKIKGTLVFRTQEQSLFSEDVFVPTDFPETIVCTPRSMVQVLGMYNSLLQTAGIAVVIEPQEIYEEWEKVPANMPEFTVANGCAELLLSGQDVTIVGVGATSSWIENSVEEADLFDISVEFIDLRYWEPFDIDEVVRKSVQKTGRLLCVIGKQYEVAVSLLMKNILDDERIFSSLRTTPSVLCLDDSKTKELDKSIYFSSKVFDAVYKLMHRSLPEEYPCL